MAAYLRTFKNSFDSLASINAPVSQSDMFTFLLAGLPSDYERSLRRSFNDQNQLWLSFGPACCYMSLGFSRCILLLC
uniref:Uncharacterized protein n=1 Tax=Solanum lycopersicum TaxID=4081 RepID=A0A3Q7JMV3_SOLLC